MRHLEVKDLWLQEAVCRGRLRLCKIRGEENPADIFTKYLGQREIEAGCARMSIEVVFRCFDDAFTILLTMCLCGGSLCFVSVKLWFEIGYQWSCDFILCYCIVVLIFSITVASETLLCIDVIFLY